MPPGSESPERSGRTTSHAAPRAESLPAVPALLTASLRCSLSRREPDINAMPLVVVFHEPNGSFRLYLYGQTLPPPEDQARRRRRQVAARCSHRYGAGQPADPGSLRKGSRACIIAASAASPTGETTCHGPQEEQRAIHGGRPEYCAIPTLYPNHLRRPTASISPDRTPDCYVVKLRS